RGASARRTSVGSQQQTASSLTLVAICPERRTCGCNTRSPRTCSPWPRSPFDVIAFIYAGTRLAT
ncbi:unnamed protein product, partial [Closterium sp. Yama58-4]